MRQFRAYFNRHAEAPQVCSIDEGEQTTEINVIGIRILPGVTCVSHYLPLKPGQDPLNTPSFWLQIECDHMEVLHGWAFFRGPEGGQS